MPRKQKLKTADEDTPTTGCFNDEIVKSVNLTGTGSKHYCASCSYLKKSKTAISREEAVEHGHEPRVRRNPLCRLPLGIATGADVSGE